MVAPAPQASSLVPGWGLLFLGLARGGVNEDLFGPQSEPSPPRAPSPGPQAAPAVASSSQSSRVDKAGAFISPDLANYMQEAIQRGINLELQHRTSSWVSDSANSQIDVEGSHLSADQGPAEARAPSIGSSGQDSLMGEELRDQDMSEDEDLSPYQPSFVGLFKPQLFRSLLHKTKTTHLGLACPTPTNPGD